MFLLFSLFLTLPQTLDLFSSLYFYFIYYICMFWCIVLFLFFVGFIFLWLTDCSDTTSSWNTSNKPSPWLHRSHRTPNAVPLKYFYYATQQANQWAKCKGSIHSILPIFFSFYFKCKAINQVAWKPLQRKNLMHNFLSCRVSGMKKLDHVKCITKKKSLI